MAASMVGCCASKLLRRMPSAYRVHVKCASSSPSYTVLLPEIPPDTPETNPIMCLEEHPHFSNISPDMVVTGCAKRCIEFDVQLGAHAENLKDGKYEKSFSNVFEPVERLLVPLNFAWRSAKNLSIICSSDQYSAAFDRINRQVVKAKSERWVSDALHNAVKEVHANKANLNEFQQRLVDFYLLEARMNGIEKLGDDRKKFMQALHQLVEDKKVFQKRVNLSHGLFSHTIDDFGVIADMPRPLVSAMAVDRSNPSRGPWKVTLDRNIYQPFLEHCGHRPMRWNIWQAFNNRASYSQDESNLSNHKLIDEIRQHSKDLAKLLGYANYAEMSLSSKMAGTIENVLSMIDSLKCQFKPIAEEEVTQLQEFARSEGFADELQMWDLPYWRRRHRQHLFKVNATDVAEYFPYPRVINFLFEFCEALFGISVKDCTSEVEVWHSDVQFYKIFNKNDGQFIASFFVDPYARPGQKTSGDWMLCGREHSELLSTTPVTYLVFSLNRPVGSQPSLLTIGQVKSVFHEFGHALQQMLTTVPYSEIAGQRYVEWDSLHTCANVLSMLLLRRHTLASLGRHHQTDEPISDELVTNILKDYHYMSSYDIMRQLYYSAYDLELFINDKDTWYTTMCRMWSQFMPMPLHDDDSHPCSFSAIFSDPFSASFYSLTWSEMVAANIIQSFDEAGLNNADKVAAVGKRFRDTYLSLGGGVHAGEVFRRFRGSDPTVDALIAYYTNT